MTQRQETFTQAVQAGLDEVWRLLTTSEGLASWFGTEAEIKALVGAAVRIGWGTEDMIEGVVAEVDAPSPDDRSGRLRIAYVHEGVEMGGEEWLLSHDGATTQVRLIHSMPDDGVENWDAFYDDMRRGWALFLRSLAFAAQDAILPNRAALPCHIPLTKDRPQAWAAALHALGLPSSLAVGDVIDEPLGLAKMTVALADAPHSLLLTHPSASLLIDMEGRPPHMVCYVQASTHVPEDEERASWRRQIVESVAAALS